MNNAERIVKQYIDGYYSGHKGDQLRLQDNAIYSLGTPIGYFAEAIEDCGDCDDYLSIQHTYLVLTMTNYKSQKNWKTHKKQLANAAMKSGIFVVFIPEIDIGFGALLHSETTDIVDDLLEVAKYSNDDIKTACVSIPHKDNEPNIFTFNQIIEGEKVHAEKILSDYLYCIYNDYYRSFYSLLEPCRECLDTLLERESVHIYYFYNHKEKWNTIQYIQRVNDIMNKSILIEGRPVKYEKINNIRVNKFYDKEKTK